jgi:limonene-1,2-epoxide hydrolase
MVTPMSSSAADVVTSFIAACERLDLDAAIDHMSADVEYWNVPMEKVYGHDGVRGVLEPFLGPFEEIEWPVSHMVAEGTAESGTVFTERVDRFRAGDVWLELPVAGMFLIRDGKITVWRDYFDLNGFMGEMGKLNPS